MQMFLSMTSRASHGSSTLTKTSQTDLAQHEFGGLHEMRRAICGKQGSNVGPVTPNVRQTSKFHAAGRDLSENSLSPYYS